VLSESWLEAFGFATSNDYGQARPAYFAFLGFSVVYACIGCAKCCAETTNLPGFEGCKPRRDEWNFCVTGIDGQAWGA
jgi:hypothetical protein